MDTLKPTIRAALEVILEEYRCELNRVYAMAADEQDDVIFKHRQREIARRIGSIKALEKLIKDLA